MTQKAIALFGTILLVIAAGCSDAHRITIPGPDCVYPPNLFGTWDEMSEVCDGVMGQSPSSILLSAKGTGNRSDMAGADAMTWCVNGIDFTETIESTDYSFEYILAGSTLTLTSNDVAGNCTSVFERRGGQSNHDSTLNGTWDLITALVNGESYNPGGMWVRFLLGGTGYWTEDGQQSAQQWSTNGNMLSVSVMGRGFLRGQYSLSNDNQNMDFDFTDGVNHYLYSFRSLGW